ncbi:hypothetical protein [Streptomyces sp. I05A-00742]|uniref:hypothetical protein n=1 Tax=Streptomyces sp. I05A-00742 TaxID=2732853 RepID=UPI0014881D4B|nr:hypothetical protein [Streptomyces sp. I05A-00742]
MHRTFTGEEFRQALNANTVTVPLALTGMVKTADAADVLQFALGTACKDWTTIPVRLIDEVEPLRHVPCDDHAHPLVRLTLKDTGTPEFTVLTSLLRAAQQQASPCGGPAAGRAEAGAARRPANVHIPYEAPHGHRAPHGSGGGTEIVRAAGVGARAACLDGDTKCDASGTCWGCCGGDWFDVGRCVYGLTYTCNGTRYQAVSCWPIG